MVELMIAPSGEEHIMANFKGFPKEFITFFENLKQNNSKDWFEKNRNNYEQFIMHPAREYVNEKSMINCMHVYPSYYTRFTIFSIHRR
jgi:uncharacterized protein (DUF2461 family)